MKDLDMRSCHGRLGGVALAACVALALFGGCSSSEAGGDTGLRCGAGTTESNGECVAALADAAPADAVTMDGGEASDASSETPGDGSVDGSDASSDAIGDLDAAGPNDAPASNDAPEEPLEPADPCPAGYSWTSCANDCNGWVNDCVPTGCGYDATVPVKLNGDTVFRLPAVPPTAPGCASCDGGAPTAVVRVYLDLMVASTNFEVKVDAPWRIIDDRHGDALACIGPEAKATCAITSHDFYIVTDAPVVPPRNVTVASTWASSCP